ncbi:hypothetical protein Tco_0162021 [Tanacetum coccineum]
MIPYPRFTKLIMSHYMTTFPEISRHRYHNLEDDVMIKSIFNSGKSKNVVGMKIPNWMITEEMKLMEIYRLYAYMFGVDVPMTQSQPIEITQKGYQSQKEQKPTRNEETSTRERFEANIESWIKTVVEKSQESKERDKGKNDHFALTMED